MKNVLFLATRSFGSKVLGLFLITVMAFLTTGCNQGDKTSADTIREEATASNQNMYVIERVIPGASELTAEQLKEISQASNGVLDEMGSDIKWMHSYVAGDKVYCVYTAPSAERVREHAKKGGFPANSVTQVTTVIDPSTGH